MFISKRPANEVNRWRNSHKRWEEDKKVTFLEKLDQRITMARKALEEKLAWIQFHNLLSFFKELIQSETTKIPMKQFSEAVLDFVGNMYFSTGNEYQIIVRDVIKKHPTLMFHLAVEQYLAATRDEETGDFYLDRFFAHDSRLDEQPTSEEVWDMRRAYAVVSAMEPDRRVMIAKLMLGMFPGLLYEEGRGGFRGLLENVIRDAEQQAVPPKQETILRAERAAPAGKNDNGRRNNTRHTDRRLPAEKYYDPAQPTEEDARVLAEYRKNNPAPSNNVIAEKVEGALQSNPKSGTKMTKPKKQAKKVSVIPDLATVAAAAGVPEAAANGHAANVTLVPETAPAAEATTVQ